MYIPHEKHKQCKDSIIEKKTVFPISKLAQKNGVIIHNICRNTSNIDDESVCTEPIYYYDEPGQLWNGINADKYDINHSNFYIHPEYYDNLKDMFDI